MGEVFLAHDDRLRRDVAIKRIRAGGSVDAEHRERLRREARAAARLSHASIVQVHDIIEEPDGDSIVMEYIEGRTVSDLIAEGDLGGPAAIDVLLQIADGLEAAHKSGLVHRDLKGENVIVGSDGDAKILDFGVAKSSDTTDGDPALTTEGMAIGTYRSMSPEQCEGGPIDSRSDLFSLGVLMYEMFGGRIPFDGTSPLQSIALVLGSNPPSVKELNGSVPDTLSALIDALLSKEPEGRPASAAAVAEALEAVQDSSISGSIVMPRLTKSPNVGPALRGNLTKGNRGQHQRRRKTTAGTAPQSRRRAWVMAAAGLVVTATVALLALQNSDRGGELSTNRVMVFPLVTSGIGDIRASVGEDVATMIGSALNGTDPLRWIDAWPLLEGDARENIRALPVAQLANLAATNGAGFLINGRMIVSADSAHAVLELYDVNARQRVATSEAAGPAAYPWRAGLSAMNTLLPFLIPTAVPDVEAGFAARPPGAVAQFLLGEQQFRRANVDAALRHFQQAFALDSTFAIAGIRGAQAASWVHEADAARDLARAVLSLPMPTRTEAFVRGILAYVEYDAEGAITHLRRALTEDSTLTVAWAALGEVYRHRAPRIPWPVGSPRPFERALAQDPDAANVLFHRLEEVIADGDLATASVLRDRFEQGESELRVEVSTMYQCLEAGPTAGDWGAAVLADPFSVTVAASQFLAGGRNFPCADALYHAVLVSDSTSNANSGNAEGRYWSGLHGLVGSRLAQGRFDEARRLILTAAEGFEPFQSLMDRSTLDESGLVLPNDDAPWTARAVPQRAQQEIALTRWSELAVLVGALYPQLADVGDLGAADIRALAGEDYSGVPYRTSIWMLGLWEARRGRPDETARASAQIRTIAAGQQDASVRAYSVRMADALDAHRLLAEGNEVVALEAFRALTTNAPEGTIFQELIGPLALERLTLAQLETRVGDPLRALELVSGFDEPSAVTYASYLPPGLAICVRNATRLGQMIRARDCEARLSGFGWSIDDLP